MIRPGVSSLPGTSFSECIAACNCAGAHRIADFGDERAALAAMAQQLAGLVLIAAGFELDDLDVEIRIGRAEQPRDPVRLRQRHHALARADP